MKLQKERMVRMLKEVTGAHVIWCVKFELVYMTYLNLLLFFFFFLFNILWEN